MTAADRRAIEEVWRERARRLGVDPIYVVRYEGPASLRVFDWFEYQNTATATAARLYRGSIEAVSR